MLVVEDSSGYAALIEQMLRATLGDGVAVVHEPTLAGAVSQLEGRVSIDCVLLDLSLPDAKGLEAVEAVHSADPDAPVVVLSGCEDHALALRAVQAGAQDYLTKRGADADLLTRAVRYAIERKRSELQLAHDALHDQLTGLPNRLLFLDRLAVALERSRRAPGSVAVMLIDLDRFTAVNDSYGHDAGDDLLVAVGERLRGSLRGGDTVARFGGDEFLLLCGDLGDDREALALAHGARALIAEPLELAGHEISVSACVGVACAEGPDVGAEALIRGADRGMRRAKQRASGVELFEAGIQVEAPSALETENGLRHAIARDELRLYYQPEVALSDGSPFAVEALLRWEHSERGLLEPGEFIGLAEESGLIVPIGEWVIGEACRALALWRREGRVSDELAVSVNLSARQLCAPGLANAVHDALVSSAIPPHCLCLEVTETSVAQDLAGANAVLAGLKRLGVRIALDDFGVGYSSLSALSAYPLDIVKIDRSFIEQASRDQASARMFVAILGLVQAAELEAVVEGIEEPWQLDLLRRVRCPTAQGFLFARPGPEESSFRSSRRPPHRWGRVRARRSDRRPSSLSAAPSIVRIRTRARSPHQRRRDRGRRPAGSASRPARDPRRRARGRRPRRQPLGDGAFDHHPPAPLGQEVDFDDGTVGYATDGTPVDCVRLARLGLINGHDPEVVVSGINHGSNLGDDITYSGTVAAALEAIVLGLPGIAVSQQSRALELDFAPARVRLRRRRVVHGQPRRRARVGAPGPEGPCSTSTSRARIPMASRSRAWASASTATSSRSRRRGREVGGCTASTGTRASRRRRREPTWSRSPREGSR